jgi:hypothetical protein
MALTLHSSHVAGFMRQIFVLVILMASSIAFADEDFDISNCRGQSDVVVVDGHAGQFSSRLFTPQPQHQPMDMELDICQGNLRTMIIRFFTDATGIVLQDDHGFVEYHPPGQKEFTRCRYEIHKGTPIPEKVLRYNGTIPTKQDFDRNEIFELVKPIVLMGCELVS